VSPPLAAAIADSPALRFAVRCALAPLSLLAAFSVGTGPAEKALVLLLVFGIPGRIIFLPVPDKRQRGGKREVKKT
jgi:hypothetical protein